MSHTFPNTNLDPLGKTGGYLQLRSFTFLHCTISIYDHFRLSQSCNSCAATVAIEIWAQMSQITSTARKTQFLAPCYYNFKQWPCTIKNTKVAPKTSTTITASWLASNLKQMQKRMATYFFAAALFRTAQSVFRTILDKIFVVHRCSKVVILVQPHLL